MWTRLPADALAERVFAALAENRSYRSDPILGVPGSFLDREVFPPLPELARFPLLSTLLENPNHIGCHTLPGSEPFFAGTQALEREVVAVCAEHLLNAEPGTIDGYVASGGTEANLQALWTFRNRLRDEGVPHERIAIVASDDTHYSVAKAADLLHLPLHRIAVDPDTRRVITGSAAEVAGALAAEGFQAALIVLNMGTTMFGTVDDPDAVLPPFDAAGLRVLCHVDAAFGGFVYPLTAPDNALDFRDPRILSVTLDAHKMLQAPYGTGIHLVRKGWIDAVLNRDATYVPGLDCTVVGSRSGANAVAVWMILFAHGPEGGRAFCAELIRRTDRFCAALDARGVRYVRQPHMNLVALRAEDVPEAVAERFWLVPETHDAKPRWRKVVIMDHVDDRHLAAFLDALA
ncbi:MAG: aspartate aminotransferase family protein [Alphaproteobacteria bacterium]|nr:aspartate aminotransferase family protein [Alphaproteobacteria bacterium]